MSHNGDRLKRLDDLQQAVAAMRAGRPIAPAAAAWIASGLQKYLDEGGELNKHLDLRPRRGGRFETPHALRRMQKRNLHLVILAGEIPADANAAKAKAMCDYFSGRGPEPVPGLARHVLGVLRALKTAIPDERQMAQIIAGHWRRSRPEKSNRDLTTWTQNRPDKIIRP